MTFAYGSLATKAATLITKFGRQLTFTRTTKGAYNTVTGTKADTTSVFSNYGCVFDYVASEVNGSTILQGDRRILSEPYSYLVNDSVSLDGKVYVVVSISENKPADTLLSVDLQVRA
tara:strand:+ start:1247 stop:1597 length:351 start_codon:yes stop_codon:yes gene_type:complete